MFYKSFGGGGSQRMQKKKNISQEKLFFFKLKNIFKNKMFMFHVVIYVSYIYIAPSYAAFTTTNANNIHSAVLGASYNYLVRPAELTNVYLEFVIFSINSVVCELAFSL